MTPPLALISSTASVAPHLTPSPVMAAGPLMAEAKPILMGGVCAPAENAMTSSRASVSAYRIAGLLVIDHGGPRHGPPYPPNSPAAPAEPWRPSLFRCPLSS